MPTITRLRYVGDGAFRAGVPARDHDQGEVDRLHPDTVAQMIGSGLYVAETDEDEAPTAAPAKSPFDGLTKVQLVALAEEEGLDLPDGALKPDILAALEENAALSPEGQAQAKADRAAAKADAAAKAAAEAEAEAAKE
jgi:hypothetical protein